MSSPFFSIVIPTRNRYNTLPYSIETVLKQEFADFELIVSDNSDQDQTISQDLIKNYQYESRIKFYRPPAALSMSDHYEFAVSRSIGEYIILFGDDDGLTAGALGKMYTIIKETKAKLVSWARVEYSWPDRVQTQLANQMIIPYMGKTGIMRSKSYIKKVITFNADYRYLPMIYNSAVNRSVIESLKSKTGRIFNAISPDIYTGYAFAWLLKEYITVGIPLSINGASSKSIGAAHEANDTSGKADFIALNKASTIKWPDTIPEIYTSYLGIIEPFVQLTKFFPELRNYITRKRIYQILIRKLESTSQKDLDVKISKILDSAKKDKAFYQWLNNYIQKVKPAHVANTIEDLENRVGFDGSHLIMDASKYGLNNVFDVSVFIGNLFGNIKQYNYSDDALPRLKKRIKKAVAIIIWGV